MTSLDVGPKHINLTCGHAVTIVSAIEEVAKLILRHQRRIIDVHVSGWKQSRDSIDSLEPSFAWTNY